MYIFSVEIKADTRMILLDAVYFESNWKKPFDKSYTEKEMFFTSNSSKLVDMMRNEDNYYWGNLTDLGVQFIEIPYEVSKIVL